MALLLGVDTGGTYTDAVILQDEERVLAKAKALTTRHDLSVGIGQAVAAVLAESGVKPAQISLASLSTTLATNALVEDHGERVALISIGFSESDLARQGLAEAMKGDPVIRIDGGHNHGGGEAMPLDLAALDRALDQWGDQVSAFAVAGQFATRNAAHEVTVRDVIRSRTGRPVSCSHDLSARLNGPKRALTAVLNARLIGLIDRLIAACQSRMTELGINAPLMVVRGDAALVSADFAREKPIETILSGPAASLVGASWLTGETDAMVSDIGGTTTDVAILSDGRPRLDPLGAKVGPFRTMVEAVAMRTSGLGGDSQVHMVEDGLNRRLRLGPRRVMPVSLAAHLHPEVVLPVLERQMGNDLRGDFDGRFVVSTGVAPRGALAAREAQVLERVGDAASMGDVLTSRMDLAALDRLIARGLVLASGVTASDAAHVLGLLDAWDTDAAQSALALLARHRTGGGELLADSPRALALMIVDQMTRQTADCLLAAAFDQDFDTSTCPDPEASARHWLVSHALEGTQGALRVDVGLTLPVIGLGASAPTWYGAVGERLKTRMVLPEHAGVANAIGAVVGRVSVTRRGTITSPAEGRFRAHMVDGPQDFPTEEAAINALRTELETEARHAARAAGAADIETHADVAISASTVESRRVFVEAEITIQASGRPRIVT